jgi:hypothetical protein
MYNKYKLRLYEGKRNEVRTGLASCPQVHQKYIELGVFCKKTFGVFLMGLNRFDGTTSNRPDSPAM